MKKLLLILFTMSCMSTLTGKTDTVITMSSEKIAVLRNLIKQKDSLVEALKSNVPEIPDSSQVTFSKVYSDVKGGIQGLASSLKVGAEHVYEILVKQQAVNSIVWLITMLAGVLLCINFIKKYKDPKEEWTTDEFASFLGVVRFLQILGGIIMLVIGVIHIDTIVSGLINPEYGAIQDIINFVK